MEAHTALLVLHLLCNYWEGCSFRGCVCTWKLLKCFSAIMHLHQCYQPCKSWHRPGAVISTTMLSSPALRNFSTRQFPLHVSITEENTKFKNAKNPIKMSLWTFIINLFSSYCYFHFLMSLQGSNLYPNIPYVHVTIQIWGFASGPSLFFRVLQIQRVNNKSQQLLWKLST